MKISRITARWILDSRGVPTVEADVFTESGVFGRAAVPAGASTGSHEAFELRDGGKSFDGQGVLNAVKNIHDEIVPILKGMPVDEQEKIDHKLIELDGTPNKSRLGANAILAVSLACAHAAAKQREVFLYIHINDLAGNTEKSLPMPMMNILNGGKHASKSADFQEFMIIPKRTDSYTEAVQIGAEIFQSLKKEITAAGISTTVGDEGGFTFPVKSNTEMLELLNRASIAAGYEPGNDISYGLDVAASEFFTDGGYQLKTEQRQLTGEQMIEYLADITQRYPVISIEDGLDQDQWDDWQKLTTKLKYLQLVGDDLLVTNTKRLEHAVAAQAANAILIKPNQVGTLTETIETIKLAKQHGWQTIVSHRSGETEDVTIAHIAIGTGAGQIKTGSLSRGERTAKHNELMRLESIDSSLRLHKPFD